MEHVLGLLVLIVVIAYVSIRATRTYGPKRPEQHAQRSEPD